MYIPCAKARIPKEGIFQMKLLIALPCFNEAEKIQQVLRSIPTSYEGIDFVRLLVVMTAAGTIPPAWLTKPAPR